MGIKHNQAVNFDTLNGDVTPRIGFLTRIAGVFKLTLELGFGGPTGINQMMTG